MTVREARPDDLVAVVSLEQDNLGADAWPPGLLQEGVEGRVPYATYLVAEVETPAGATVAGHAVLSAVGDIAELQRISVDAEHRRAGVATALLDAVVGTAREAGADRLLLEVREDNTGALSFYAARGFVEVDRRPRYYRDGTTAVVLRRGLGPACGGRGDAGA